MSLRLYNTLSGRVEEFKPIDEDNVRMYVCGPTVYGRPHLGNARPVVVFDVLYRLLKSLYSKVTYVRNITDVDDKIYAASIEKGISIQELTDETIRQYHEDVRELNVLDVDVEPRATEHIFDMIDFIKRLIDKGSAYYSDGHVYFSVSSFSGYGQLSKKDSDELIAGARVRTSESKSDPMDFVLWKPMDDNFKVGWESPWGLGRPGWHIECSAMCLRYLGERFDIHGGGIDLVFPHHENEIAQSCSLSQKSAMANYWVHNGHLTIDGTKMSKSLGNFMSVRDVLSDFDGEVVRMLFLMTHYASPMNFSYDSLGQAKSIIERWYNAIRDVRTIEDDDRIIEEAVEPLLDNMNTPKSISVLSSVVDSINKTTGDKSEIVTHFVNTCRRFLGILTKDPYEWFNKVDDCRRNMIESKVRERNIAREERDFETADRIKMELLAEGVILEDTKHGTTWKTRS